MLNVGDIVRFKNQDQWGILNHGIIEDKLPMSMITVRFETGSDQPYHFSVPVLEEWMIKAES